MKLSTSLLLHMDRRIRWGRTPMCINSRLLIDISERLHWGTSSSSSRSSPQSSIIRNDNCIGSPFDWWKIQIKHIKQYFNIYRNACWTHLKSFEFWTIPGHLIVSKLMNTKNHIMKLSTSLLLLYMERRIWRGRTPRWCIHFRFLIFLNDYNEVHLGRVLNLSYRTIIVSDHHFIAEKKKKAYKTLLQYI